MTDTATTTPTTSRPAKRPVYVTFLTVLGVLQGLVLVGLGLFTIIDRNDDEFLRRINESDVFEDHQMTSNLLLAAGITALLTGLLLICLAVLLSKGSNFVRWLVVLVSTVNAAVGLHALVALDGEQRLSGSFSLMIALVTIWLLAEHEESKRFFEG